MKSGFALKALSLAVFGLGFTANALAVCPTDPAQPAGPWTSKSTLGGNITIVTPGFATTECAMQTKITTNGPGVSAFVRDNTPAGETRYRAKFLVNVDGLGSINSAQTVKIFGANTDTAYLTAGEVVKFGLVGNLAGSAKFLSIFLSTETAGPALTVVSDTAALAAGVNTIQVDWVKGTSATVKVWVNSATEASPTKTYTANTNGWVVDFATLGLASPSPLFRASHIGSNDIAVFDEFDSRRSTFIN